MDRVRFSKAERSQFVYALEFIKTSRKPFTISPYRIVWTSFYLKLREDPAAGAMRDKLQEKLSGAT